MFSIQHTRLKESSLNSKDIYWMYTNIYVKLQVAFHRSSSFGGYGFPNLVWWVGWAIMGLHASWPNWSMYTRVLTHSHAWKFFGKNQCHGTIKWTVYYCNHVMHSRIIEKIKLLGFLSLSISKCIRIHRMYFLCRTHFENSSFMNIWCL